MINLRLHAPAAALLALVLCSGSALALPPEEKAARVEIKNNTFGGLSFQRADAIEAGEAEPLLNFVARDSLFINWVIPRRNVAAFERALNLPAGFRLARTQIVRGERPRYFLSLNVYEVTIDVPAFRAEWSVYVTKGDDPTPRFMVIEALSSAATFDPVLGAVDPVDFQFSRDGDAFAFTIDGAGTRFEASFDGRTRRRARRRAAALEWVKANDLIYWTNGIADQTFYNRSLTRARMTSVRPGRVDILDGSRWAEFVHPCPEHVLLFNEPLQFAVTPWVNIEDPSVALDPVGRATLQAVKAQAFSGLARLDASQIIVGAREALVDFSVETTTPAVFFNFRVPHHAVDALSDFIELPDGLHLAPMRTTRGGSLDYLVSLNIYEATGVAAGKRAEWSVYVARDEAPWRRYYLIVDVAADGPSLDPVNLFTAPAEQFSYATTDGVVRAAIVNQGRRFEATFPASAASACDRRISRGWAEANDRFYWRNGMYDLGYYNGALLDARVASVAPHDFTVRDETVWADFVDPNDVEVLVFCERQEYRLSPWYNLEEL